MSNNVIFYELDSSGNIISPFYGYTPKQGVSLAFVILFAVTTLAHLGQAIHFRAWWLLPTAVLAGFGEVLGWAGRLWSSYEPLNNTPFMIQICCTIIAPTPLVGAVFITFGRMSARIGEQYGRLSSRLYSRIFLTCDIISLVIQSVGGGIASSAQDNNVARLGSNIMLVGIVFQLVSLTAFTALAVEFLLRYARRNKNENAMIPPPHNISEETLMMEGAPASPQQTGLVKPMKLLLVGVCLETLFLFIRAIYRTIELSDGFNGRIIRTEIYFIVLDGFMVVAAMFVMNIFHPAQLLQAADKKKGIRAFTLKNTSDVYVQA